MNDKLSIGILYLGKGSGIAHCTLEIARRFNQKANVVCFLAAQNNLLDEFQANNLECQVFDIERGAVAIVKSFMETPLNNEIVRSISELHPDILLCTGGGWQDRIILWHLRSSPVFTAEMIHDAVPHPGLEGILWKFYDFLRPNPSDAIIGLSDNAYRIFKRKYPSKKIISSQHGVILAAMSVDQDEIAERRKKLLFFGRLRSYKGLKYLLEAYQQIKKEHPDYSLTVAGEGRLSKEELEYARDSKVHLINEYVSDSELQKLLATHGVIVAPYTSATQSGVISAALASALPVISTNVGALSEQVVDGETGFIVEPKNTRQLAEAILKLGENRELALKMSRSTSKLASEKYDWDKITEKLLVDLMKCLRNNNHQREDASISN